MVNILHVTPHNFLEFSKLPERLEPHEVDIIFSVSSVVEDENIHEISHASDYNYPLGNEQFKDSIEKTLNRQVGYDKRGRPKTLTG